MPQPDIAALAADVLAKHEAGITPLPWTRDVRTVVAAAEIDEFNGGDGYGTATLLYAAGSTRIPAGRDIQNLDYATLAANSAPALARQVQADAATLAELRAENERLNEMRVHCQDCGGDYLQTGVETGCPCRLRAELAAAKDEVERLKPAADELDRALDEWHKALSRAESSEAELAAARAELAAAQSALGTEQTMHAAWRKRAEECEQREEQAKLPKSFQGIEGVKPVDKSQLAEYEQAMTEAIPEIIEDVRKREQLAHESRQKYLG